jgi:hypothetical protein
MNIHNHGIEYIQRIQLCGTLFAANIFIHREPSTYATETEWEEVDYFEGGSLDTHGHVTYKIGAGRWHYYDDLRYGLNYNNCVFSYTIFSIYALHVEVFYLLSALSPNLSIRYRILIYLVCVLCVFMLLYAFLMYGPAFILRYANIALFCIYLLILINTLVFIYAIWYLYLCILLIFLYYRP